MGLDAYFYKHVKVTQNDIITYDNLINVFNNNDKLKEKLNRLNAYANSNNLLLADCLYNAINNYLNNNEYGYCNELLYFRKFHYLLDYFKYDDDWYAKDMPVTKEQCIELRDKAKVCLEECEKVYKEHNCYVKSYLTDSMLADTRNYERSFNDEDDTGIIINEICNKHFPSDWKDAIYDKVGHLYQGMNSIVNSIDWEHEELIFNADW